MKKHGKMILPNILLVLSLLLSGCGENAETLNETNRGDRGENSQGVFEETKERKEESTAEENRGEILSEEESDNTEETTGEEDQPPDESLFEYYDLLDAEYEKYGITSPADFSLYYSIYVKPFYFSSKEQTLVFKFGNDSWGENELFTYNIKNKELKKSGLTPGRYPDMGGNTYWCGDIMYGETFWNLGEKRIYVRNFDGSFISSEDEGKLDYFSFDGDERWDGIRYSENEIYSQPDGALFLTVNIKNEFLTGGHTQYMISPDRKVLTELPKPEIEVEHGIKETRKFEIIGCWNNRVYAIADDIGFCCLDTNTLVWEILDKVEHFGGTFKSVGRYLMSNCTVFDMETNEVIVHNDNFSKNCGSFAKSYYGGKYNVIKKNGSWYFCRCTSDGSDVDFKYYEKYSLGEQEESYCYPISDEYYVYADEYGHFLRRYETGADWEETIFLYDEVQALLEENS